MSSEIYGSGDDGTIEGTSGDDVIYGTEAVETIYGGLGADKVYAGAGNDYVSGWADDDELEGGAGSDIIDGGEGNDTLFAYRAILLKNSDVTGIPVDTSSDTLLGGTGDDLIFGGDGSDKIDGGDDNDEIYGGKGNDEIYGGKGNDFLQGQGGRDFIYGGDGNDTLEGGGVGQPYGIYKTTISYENDQTDILAGGAGDDTYWIKLNGVSDVIVEKADEGHDTVNLLAEKTDFQYKIEDNVEDVNVYSNMSGVILGNALNNRIFIEGGEASVELHGNDGNDSLAGANGSDYLYGDGQNDKLNGGDGWDLLYGGAGNDELHGGHDQYNDKLIGGTGNDILFSEGKGDAGLDVLVGGAGDDQYVIQCNRYTIVEVPNEGTDSLTFNLSGLYNHVFMAANVENAQIVGSKSVDLDGNLLNNQITGNNGDNVIDGAGGNDKIYGMVGNDVLHGGTGDDLLDGGTGNDTLDGGKGTNSLKGGFGNDIFVVNGSGDKVIEAHDAGYDLVYSSLGYYHLTSNVEELRLVAKTAQNGDGNAWDNHIYGNAYDNFISGEDGKDAIFGYAGNDNLQGGDKQDVVDGGAGNDLVMGDAGDDKLYGASGKDVLIGGQGADILSGGVQNDVFRYNMTLDSTVATYDTITDFQKGDKIDLSRIDADTHTWKDDGFGFLPYAPVFKDAGDLWVTHGRTGDTVWGDTDGDGKAELRIFVKTDHDLSAADFVL